MRVEYDINTEEMQKAKEVLAATNPAEVRVSKSSNVVLHGFRSVLTAGLFVGGGAFYSSHVLKIEDTISLALIGGIVIIVIGFFLYKAIVGYLNAKSDVTLASGKSRCIEVLINELCLIDNGVRSKIGRYDVKRFVNTQGYFFLYLDSKDVVVIPPSAFEDNVLRESFREAVNEIIQGSQSRI